MLGLSLHMQKNLEYPWGGGGGGESDIELTFIFLNQHMLWELKRTVSVRFF